MPNPAKLSPTKVRTGRCVASYCNLLEPKSINGSEPTYSVAIIIPKSDKETIQFLQEAIKSAYDDGIESGKFGKKKPAFKDLDYPLHDSDVEKEADDHYEDLYKDTMYINAKMRASYGKPTIVGLAKDTHGKFIPLDDPTEVYSGMGARFTVNAFAYNWNGKPGLSFGLNNTQKLDDGTQIGGVSKPENDFDDIDISGEEFDFLN